MIRAGLLGTGYWATHTHAPGLTARPDVEFVGVWGRSSAKTEELAASLGVRAYDGVDKLVQDVDLVSIAVPPDVQARLAIQAAERGRHLLLEKPVALDLGTARHLADVVARRQVSSLVFLKRRFDPHVNAFVEGAVAAGGWHGGRLIHCSSMDGADNPYAASPWRRSKGGLWDVGPHALAIVLPVLGPVDRVTAVSAPFHTHHVVLKHRSSAVSNLILSINTPRAAAEWSATFVGESGVLSMLPGEMQSPIEAYTLAIERLLTNIRGGVIRDPLDVHAAVDVIAVLAAAEESATRRTMISL